MALVFKNIYEFAFDTTAGTDIGWEVDILRSYRDDEPTPSWVSNPVRELVGSSEPVEIEYERDYDVYKPIQGSTANLNLIVEYLGQYEDFSNGSPYEYQLRIRYRDADNNLQPYWCGFFSPLDSTELVTTFPFGASYTAVDGLGLLEQAAPERQYTDQNVNIFQTFIVPALAQTGLGLDIYVDSQITATGINGDALTKAAASNFARWKSIEQEGELFTYKELLEGYLLAFNCKVTQAFGRWYIYNASSLADTTTWEVYDSEGTQEASVTESLVKTIDGSDSQTLVPIEEGLQLNLRRPNGSVECRPNGLVERQFAANGNFNDGTTGWDIRGNSSQVNIVTESDGNKKLTIYQNYFSSSTLFDNPLGFVRNADGYPIDGLADIEVKFDWIPEKIFEDAVELYWNVSAEFTAVTNNALTLPTGYNTAQYRGQYYTNWLNYNYTPSTTTNTLYYNQQENKWSRSQHHSHHVESASETNVLLNVSRTFPNPTSFYGEDGAINISNLKFYVTFFALGSRDGKRRDGASLTRVRASLDNISVKNMFANDIITPTFERVQPEFTSTYAYTPLFASTIPGALYQKIVQNDFTRDNVSLDTDKTLEQIGTQLKLNDFREQFRYYEGALINTSTVPLSNINKVFLNWGSVGYTESAAGIMNGGTFKPKSNVFDTSFYIPNQSGDQSPQDFDGTEGYSEVNVDLIPEQFPGRSEQIVYTVAHRVNTVDGNGDEVQNGLVPDQPFHQIIGLPGTKQTIKLTLFALDGYGADTQETMIAPDSILMPEAEAVEVSSIETNGRNAELTLTITLPERSEFEELFINGVLEAFTADNREYDVTFLLDSSVTNASITSTMRGLRGGPGSVTFVEAIISPLSGHQLDATTFNSVGTLPTGITELGFSQLGTSVIAEYSVEFQQLNSAGTITISGDPATVVAGGVATSTVTLNIEEDNSDGGGPGIDNVSINRTQIVVSGFHGQRSTYDIFAYANDGYELSSNNFSVTENLDWIEMSNAYGGGESVGLPLTIVFPTTDQTGTVTLNGSAQEIGADVFAYEITAVNNIANTTVTERTETLMLNEGQVVKYTNTVSASSGYDININDVTLTGTDWYKGDAGRNAVNFSKLITGGAADQTDQVTISGTARLEPYRFRIGVNTAGLFNASPNQPLYIAMPFSADDVDDADTLNFSVAGIGDYAFLPGDSFSVSAGDGISLSTPVLSGGVYNFVATLTYPTSADLTEGLNDIESTITISGEPTMTVSGDDRVEVILNFIDSVDNGAPAVPSATLSGLPGTTATYYAITIPDAGFRVTAGNITTTDGSTVTAIGPDETRGLNVVTPITITFPSVNTTIPITVDGDTTSIGISTSTYALSVVAGGANFTVPDYQSPNVFEGVSGQGIEANIFIQSNSGYSLTELNNIVAPSGVTVGSYVLIGDGIILPITVDAGVANSGTLTFDGVTSLEPYLLTINLSETLPQGKLSTHSLTRRFSTDDSTETFTDIQIQPTEGGYGYTALNQVTITPPASNVAITNERASAGIVSFDIVVTLPTDPDGDISHDIVVTAGEAPQFSGSYGLVPSAEVVSFQGTDLIDGVLYRIAFVPVISTPVQGAFSVTNVTGGTAFATSNGVSVRTIATGSILGGISSDDVQFTITHDMDSNLSEQVTVADNIFDYTEEEPATTASISSPDPTVSVNGGSGEYVINADGRWEVIASGSLSNPFAGFPLSGIGVSLSSPAGGSGDRGGEFTLDNQGDYLQNGNRIAYIHVISPGQTSGAGFDSIQIDGGGGLPSNTQPVVEVSTIAAALNGDMGVLYVVPA